ncbi:Flp pilus assembly complex ATPase component TadA [Candidatus Sumerlaeota bacterium]|nr:Flp pilus assembly complex ATPase component TadA [Candidatus Sumerlaeota bacterium]
MMQGSGMQLGQILVNNGKLDPDDLEMALRDHRRTGERLGEILVKMNLTSIEDVLRALSQQLSMPFIKLGDLKIPKEIIELIPAKLVTHYHLVPIDQNNGVMRVAVSDPLDIHTLDDLRMALKMDVEPVISSPKEIEETIKKYYGIGAETVEELMDESKAEGDSVEVEGAQVEDIDEMAEDASIVRFVNQIISEAFRDRATDIHIEPLEKELRIRYRIDGVLYEAAIPPAIRRFQNAIISRVKIMADMNIAERRLPQDGKIKVKMGELDYDLRVSSVPTPYGESIAIRILSRDSELCALDRLGFDKDHIDILREMIVKPHGIILITGPTGSGKSTTLYAALSEINSVDKKIITIEDPIEYRIPGVTQINVVPPIGLTFARILRNLLRQDPDVIMVGEIRDQETAEITIRTALTGHLVFSTIHTNDACGAVTRLQDMGIEPFLVSSSVEGIIAQRLVRVLCKECKASYSPRPEIITKLNTRNEDISEATFYRPVGCEKCRYTGYHGRTAIYELVRINEPFRRMIVNRDPANILRREAIKWGMKPIRLDGWHKVKNGFTTVDEVLRVTMEDEFFDSDG